MSVSPVGDARSAALKALDDLVVVPTAEQIDRMIARRQAALGWLAQHSADRECSHGACVGDRSKPDACDCWPALLDVALRST